MNQARSGHEVCVISGPETGSEGSLLEEASNAPYRLVVVPDLVREVSPLLDLKALLKLVQFFVRNPADICHTHTSKAGILGRLAAKMAGVPIIIHTPHGHVFHSYFSPAKTLVFKWVEILLARIATDRLVLLTRSELREHLEHKIIPAHQTHVIPSGVSLQQFSGGRRLKASDEGLTVGYVGRLADVKGPLDLVAAMSSVCTMLPHAHLIVVGDGPQRSEIEQAVSSLGLTNNVTLAGWQDNVAGYLAKFDLLVIPSHNEGMGRVAVEAKAAAIPIVATEVGGLLDLITPGYSGILCPPRDPRRLANAIVAVLTQSDCGRAMGRNGAREALEFSEEVMFKRLEALYENLARAIRRF